MSSKGDPFLEAYQRARESRVTTEEEWQQHCEEAALDRFEATGDPASIAAAGPTRRRMLTPEECARYSYPLGTEARCRDDGSLIEVWAGDETELTLLDPAGWHAFEGVDVRMSCLRMATRVADGAAPLPFDEIMRWAEAFWRFARTGQVDKQT